MKIRNFAENRPTSQTTSPQSNTLCLNSGRKASYQNPNTVSQILQSYQTLISSNNVTISQLTLDLQLTRQKLAITETRYSTLVNTLGKQNKQNIEDLLDKIDSLENIIYDQKNEIRKLKAQKLHEGVCNLQAKISKQGLIEKKNLTNFFNMESIRQNNQVLKRKRKNSLEEQQNSYSWKKILETYQDTCEDTTKFKNKTFNMVKKFIPHEERSKIWPIIFQDKLGITDTLYIQLLQRKNAGFLEPFIEHQIEKDIERSFDHKMNSQDREALGTQVREILQIFHLLRPDVSYVQGMTYPAIILTSVVGKFGAFRIFSNLIISNQFFRRMYSFQDNYVEVYCRVFDQLLKQFQLPVYNHLENLNIKSQIFLIQWFFTLFSRGMSIQTTLKIWDMLGYQQQVVLYRVSLGIFEVIGKRLLQEDYEKTIGLIRSFGSYIDQNKLLEGTIKNNLLVSDQKLDRVIKKVSKRSINYYERQ